MLVDRRKHVAAEPAVGLVAILLGADPVQPLNVVCDYELGTVLAVLETTDFLAAGTRKDAYPVVEDAVHRLPVLVAFQRRFWARVVNALVFEVAVVPQDQVVVAQLVLDAGGVDARLAARVGQKDDEGIQLGCSSAAQRGRASDASVDLAHPRNPISSTRLRAKSSSAWHISSKKSDSSSGKWWGR